MIQKEWPERFEKVLRAHLPLAGEEDIAADAALADLGLDSLELVSLLLNVEDTFAITFPDQLLMPETFATAGSLWSAIAELDQRAQPPGSSMADRK